MMTAWRLLVAEAHTATWVTYARVSKDTLGVGYGVANQLADLESGPQYVAWKSRTANGNGIVSREDHSRGKVPAGYEGHCGWSIPNVRRIASDSRRRLGDEPVDPGCSRQIAGAKRLRITATATPESISA